MREVAYHGSYAKLDSVPMSQAYASTLNISFEVRGGLLVRQIHHWAADLDIDREPGCTYVVQCPRD
jgi:ubiquinol-cytochrome c reductase cytochrome b subunit